MTDAIDPYSMTPEAAGVALGAISAAMAPAPPPEAPTDPAGAAARLSVLTADKDWATRYFNGEINARREFAQLTELAAGDKVEAAMAGAVPFETMRIGDGTASLKEMAAGADELRALGLND